MTRLRIKICGVTREADAVEAAEQGADALGLNFYARSPRCIDRQKAAAILKELPPFVEPVALFVNQACRAIRDQLQGLDPIRTIQWHGENLDCTDLASYRYILAFPVRDEASLGAILDFVRRARSVGSPPAAILVDAAVPGAYGGTGQKAPWKLLADFRPEVPLILAGGLTPDNVAEAVRLVRPYAVDVASGVESAPGVKDAELMRRFIGNALAAAAP